MKKVVLIVIAILSVILFTACSATDALSPDKVVEKMWQAANDGDGKSLLECFDTEAMTYKRAKRVYDKGELTDTKTIYSVIGLDLSIDKVEVLSVRLDESDETTAKVTAELKVTSSLAGTMEAPIEFNLIKKDGKWYLKN